VWWLVGLDQFVWPLLAGWIFLKWCVQHPPVRFPAIFVVFLLLLTAFLGSLSAVEEGRRYLTFVRNYGIYLGGFLTIFVVVQTHRSILSVKKTLAALIILSMMISFSGFLAILGLDFSFQAPLSALVPGGTQAGYLADIFQKTFTQAEASWFATGFVRPKGLMMYPNILAGMILMALPFKILFFLHGSSQWRRWLTCFLFIDGIVVLHTLSRSGWMGVSFACLLLLLVGKLQLRKAFQWSAAVMVLLMFAIPLGAGDVVMTRFIEKGHSNESRLLNYLLVLDQSTKDTRHFILGYGTQRDIEELEQPLGSHSTYFGQLYKYGIVGLGLFVCYCFLLLRSQLRIIWGTRIRLWRHFSRALFCSLLILMIQAVFIELDVDVTYAHVWWVLSGIAIALSEIYRRWNQGEQSHLERIEENEFS
jgi:hypothetical protein